MKYELIIGRALPLMRGDAEQISLGCRVLAGLARRDVVDALVGCLEHQEWFVREEAVKALFGAADSTIIHAVLPRLGDALQRVRNEAAKLIANGCMSRPDVCPGVCQRLMDGCGGVYANPETYDIPFALAPAVLAWPDIDQAAVRLRLAEISSSMITGTVEVPV